MRQLFFKFCECLVLKSAAVQHKYLLLYC